MRHAQSDALDRLEPLLERLRSFGQLRERKRGLFYFRSKSFLHFHEDPAGLFADLSVGGEDWRLRVSHPSEQSVLIERVAEILANF